MLKFFKSLFAETIPVHYCRLCMKAYESNYALEMADSCEDSHFEDLKNPYSQEYINSLFKNNLSKALRYIHNNTEQSTALPISYCLAVHYEGEMIAFKNAFDESDFIANGDFLVSFDKNSADAYPIKASVFAENYSLCVEN